MVLNVNFKSLDKANPNYERVIYPVKDDADFKVTITPVKNLESTSYISMNGEKTNVIEGMLLAHVKKIEGLTIEFSDDIVEITEIKQLLDLPRDLAIEGFLTDIFREIMSYSGLEDDEIKNLD